MSILNLQKNDILDLTKKDPSLNNIILGCGWDITKDETKKGLFGFLTSNFDLDLVALLLDENDKLINKKATIYFGDKEAEGIRLHGDNMTGRGDGDDERISVELNHLPKECMKVLFAVTIFGGKMKKQDFSKVNNAYIRVLNADKNEEEICRYNLSEDGGDATTLVLAHLQKRNENWEFRAIGELLNANLTSLTEMYR